MGIVQTPLLSGGWDQWVTSPLPHVLLPRSSDPPVRVTGWVNITNHKPAVVWGKGISIRASLNRNPTLPIAIPNWMCSFSSFYILALLNCQEILLERGC